MELKNEMRIDIQEIEVKKEPVNMRKERRQKNEEDLKAFNGFINRDNLLSNLKITSRR